MSSSNSKFVIWNLNIIVCNIRYFTVIDSIINHFSIFIVVTPTHTDTLEHVYKFLNVGALFHNIKVKLYNFFKLYLNKLKLIYFIQLNHNYKILLKHPLKYDKKYQSIYIFFQRWFVIVNTFINRVKQF